MTLYKRFFRPLSPTGGAADAAGFAMRNAFRLRVKARKVQEAALVDWEEEGGSLAAPSVVLPSP